MNSFGLHETLVVRRVIAPTLVATLIERWLPWPGFATLRAKAETQARARTAPRVPSLAEIYAELPSGEQREAARAEELRLEAELLAPVPANLRRLQGGDTVLADTHLASDTLRETLRRFGLRQLPALQLSGETGLALRDARLWDTLEAGAGKPDWHVGSGADCEEPRRRGWRLYAFEAGAPSHWENTWVELGDRDGQAGLTAGAVAGCARAARLAHFDPADAPIDALLCDIAGAVLAPVLVAFADELLDHAAALGLKRLLVASGIDGGGQLLHRVAAQRARTRKLGVEAVYAYAGGELPGAAEARQWCAALGIDGRAPLLLAERGWRGEALAWVHALLARAGLAAHLHGLSFGVSELARPGAVGGTAAGTAAGSTADAATDTTPATRGWAFAAGHSGSPRAAPRLVAQRPMLAALLAADEGRFTGFKAKGKALLPRLGAAPEAATLKAIRLQQGAVLAFVHEWAALEATTRGTLRIEREAALAVLEHFLHHPRREDAEAFAGRAAADDDGGAARPLVTRLSAGAGLAQRGAWGAWPEGSLALLGAAPLAPLMRLVRRLRS